MSALETLLGVPPGYRSPRVAQFMWQLDEQRRSLLSSLPGLTPADLSWQPAPGMNSVGMLLAHIAYAEAHLTEVGILGKPVGDAASVVGFSEEVEGLPLAPGAPPSPGLEGKDLAFFESALARAREHTRQAAAGLTDTDLERKIERKRADGTQRVFNVGWVFYHILEHEAGHRAQIGLLRHLHRLASVA